MGDELDVMSGWFDELAEGGKVGQPLAQQAWGDTYGDVMDKYGIEWLFNVAANTGGDLPS